MTTHGLPCMRQWQLDEIAKAEKRLLDELDERLPREPGEGAWPMLVVISGVALSAMLGGAIVLNALTGV